jgi:hypothetical protein
MKIGDLVRITRASIGVPVNSLALVLRRHQLFDDFPPHAYWARGKVIWEVQMLDCVQRTRRYLERDLELLNESR